MQEPQNSQWERDVLTKLAMASVQEQRRTRRWRIFFVLLGFLYFGIFLLILTRPNWEHATNKTGEHIAIVNVFGVIAADTPANAETISKSLRMAFEDKNTQAVMLRINSPGGSPVQAGIIYDEAVRLRNQNPEIPLYAIIEDIGASGGYYIAAAAEKIYADKASIVGSIGVRMDGFGLVDAIDKLGIERRLLTAGENKALLDPFLPEDPTTTRHIQALLDQVHQQFIAAVKQQRASRLVDNPELFSGLIWTGAQSIELGLIDGLGSVDSIARDIFNNDNLQDFTQGQEFLQQLMRDFGVNIKHSLRESLKAELQ